MAVSYHSVELIKQDIHRVQRFFSAHESVYEAQRRASEFPMPIPTQGTPRHVSAEHSMYNPNTICPLCSSESDIFDIKLSEVRNPESIFIPLPTLIDFTSSLSHQDAASYFQEIVSRTYHTEYQWHEQSIQRYHDFIHLFSNNPFFNLPYLYQKTTVVDDSDETDMIHFSCVGFSLFSCMHCEEDFYLLPNKFFYDELQRFEHFQSTNVSEKYMKHIKYETICTLFTIFVVSHAFYYAFKKEFHGKDMPVSFFFQSTSPPTPL